ncbi:response regulator [Schleiferia thermophila]|jgi:DNA-binding response OmpR family regulator|uniref:Response regulator receiver domain-containing protein n=1 Tax=Schleiferia thermophila TaxID=884107 RepID=A0A369A448_9FLAO|nr:response regulator [Schleiferia thermophila]KFD39743.1 chemotaxis protein CheY [Schleiferia thermophila str. Yellowstone]RCX03943.1 response regulator receiver domain-containing protein [Schleiferia thermophila]GCD80177.1 two-component system response regulator [Schleiferia thermophila]
MTKKQVLIIDDQPVMRKLLEQFLKDKYEVKALENGREALEWMYDGNIPDVVIADLNMPEIDGFEYIKRVRESAFFQDIPLIVLSGEDSSTERIKCLKLGANDYLIKPFNPEELALRINNLVRIRS